MKSVVPSVLSATLTAAIAGAALLAAPAASAMPVTLSITSGVSLQAYSGSLALNAGLLDNNSVLWVVREQARDGLQSWYLAYDPLNPRRLLATLDFGAPIVAVYTTSRELADTLADWSVDIDGDGVFDDYATRPLMGLEREDSVTWAFGGTTLALDWRADDPGDHVRVLVWQPANDVPEPGSLALTLAALGLLGGLGASGKAARRR